MNAYIDLNSDIGEGWSDDSSGSDRHIIEVVSSVNIACGWHAGDPRIMEQTVLEAGRHGVGIGAHPSYPDPLGFGRRKMDISPEDARTYVIYQVGALMAFARASGYEVRHVKLHGAFYNQASADPILARATASAVRDISETLIVLALSGSRLAQACKDSGQGLAEEVFADRGYRADGSLVPRGEPGAIITDTNAVAQRAVRMARDGLVMAVDGSEIAVHADSICVHGDNQDAVAHLQAIRRLLNTHGVEIRSLGT